MDIYEWSSHFPQEWSDNTTLLMFSSGVLAQNMIIPAVNNPRFDIVGFEKSVNGNECEC
jgi:hypothetical protein